MAYVTVLKSNCKNIVEEDFVKWLDSKDKEWWHKYGLCPTGEYQEQDDEADVKELVHSKIDGFNNFQTLNSDGDVGCGYSLVYMISEYLMEEHKAKKQVSNELYSDSHFLIVRE